MFEFTGRMSRKSLMGEFFRVDDYGLRDFKKDEIDSFLDIGANTGIISLQARVFFRNARIFAIEPGQQAFGLLKKNMRHFGVNCYRLALGDGTPVYLQKGGVSAKQLYNNNPKEDKESCPSMTIEQLFKKFNLPGESTFVTIDCEGGERCLLDQDVHLLKKCKRVAVEVHGKKNCAEMIPWFREQFADSHAIELTKPEDNGINVIKMTRNG